MDYIPKPFTPRTNRQVLGRIIKARKLQGRVAELESRLSTDLPTTDLATAEPAIAEGVRDGAQGRRDNRPPFCSLARAARAKTILARAIHANSPQKDNAFVTVNCPSLSREFAGERTVRPRQRRVHRRRGRHAGQGCDSGWRHVVLDESANCRWRFNPSCSACCRKKNYERVGEAKTRHANVRVISADEPQPSKLPSRSAVSARPVLPPERHLDSNASLARAPGRFANYRRELLCGFLRGNAANGSKAFPRKAAQALRQISLARQPARITQCRGTRRHSWPAVTRLMCRILPEKLSQTQSPRGGRNSSGRTVSLEETRKPTYRRVIQQSGHDGRGGKNPGH